MIILDVEAVVVVAAVVVAVVVVVVAAAAAAAAGVVVVVAVVASTYKPVHKNLGNIQLELGTSLVAYAFILTG